MCLLRLILSLLFLATTLPAAAVAYPSGPITSGHVNTFIAPFDGDRDGQADDLPVIRVFFTIPAGSNNVNLRVDALVAETDPGSGGASVDRNRDGFITGVDTATWLGRRTGSGWTSVTGSVNNPGSNNRDGSFTPGPDPDFRQSSLDAGDYFVAIGVQGYSFAQAQAGVQLNTPFNGLTYGQQAGWAAWRLTFTSVNGKPIIITGVGLPPGFSVPEPSWLALIALGGAAWWMHRRRLVPTV